MQPQNNTPTKTSNPAFPLHPDPILAAERLTITAPKRFWEKTVKSDGCWKWIGQEGITGPIIARGNAGSTIAARKLSWLIHFGAMPKGKKSRNACGNNLCVRPDHLRLGGAVANMILTPEAIQRAEAVSNVQYDDPAGQDPDLPEGFSRTFRQRFWAKVDKRGPNECWPWTACRNQDGYGYIGVGGHGNSSTVSAHRASWLIHYGTFPPPEQELLHKCPDSERGNPWCVNPAHLEAGTHRENMVDAVNRDRARNVPHWTSRISTEQIQEIRDTFAKGGKSKKDIADEYGIDQSHISRIISGDRHTRIT